jgi:hypothetical protein
MRPKATSHIRLRTVNPKSLDQNLFETFILDQLRCVPYRPLDSLEKALAKHGLTKIYADAMAGRILENPTLIAKFLSNQKNGLGFAPNIKATFRGQNLIVIRYGKDTVCIMANPENIRTAERIELIEVAERETEREGVLSRGRDSLIEIELGDMFSGPNQDLLTARLERRIPFRGKDK